MVDKLHMQSRQAERIILPQVNLICYVPSVTDHLSLEPMSVLHCAATWTYTSAGQGQMCNVLLARSQLLLLLQ